MEADNQQQDSTAVAIGQELRAAREGKGLSIGEVADRLKLSVKQLNAIERGDFASLPGATFARGFVRSYARYMEMNADALVARLDQCVPLDTPPAALVPVNDAPAKASLALPLSLGALLVIAGGWFLLPGAAEPEVQSSVPLALVPTVADPDASALQPTTSDVVAVTPPVVPASAPQPAAPPVTAPLAVAASAPSATAPVAGQGRIELRVRQEAWVSITDADGKKLVYATLAANDSRQLQGRPPFRVVIGNAANAELAYNGQPVDLGSKIRGTTAKLELN
ncbi:helix-turn-helix domain-containing protein [Vogesella sp. AC12]|uniref:helix-turn-helix domain-containing protein n=1 Tax=Vogesella sp. AC12 TaxID=2950550 RepID=UPI002108C214|nr:helix-turn-helix domain-containing protein [Vogesella sp. AC12]MCQ4144864.1 DUF4115 domain-containing protein [Vogesella sp. AC12]